LKNVPLQTSLRVLPPTGAIISQLFVWAGLSLQRK
jgi:hypothetical protein